MEGGGREGTYVWFAPFGVRNQEIAPAAREMMASTNTRKPDIVLR